MVKISGGDGFSFEEAIKISDCSNIEGVEQEYIEVRKRLGNYQLIRQSLQDKNERMYDVLELKLESGREITFYFDITDFFGKGLEF
jgi:hypothetical protein